MSESIKTPVCRVELEETGQTFVVAPGTLALDTLRSNGVKIATTCGGKGTCGQCLVVFSGDHIARPGPRDLKHLGPSQLNRGLRLACCTSIDGDVKIRLPEKKITGTRLQTEGDESDYILNPGIQIIHLSLPPAKLEDSTPDLERLFLALERDHELQGLTADHRVVGQLTDVLRQHDWELKVCLRGGELVAALPPTVSPIGLAIDLGTTKIAGSLINLTTGKTLASAGILNPQTIFGADVMSRLHYACRNTDSNELSVVVQHGLDGLLSTLVHEAHIDVNQVVDACVVANTAMIHLLLEFPVRQLSHAPYVASTQNEIDIKARDLSLHVAPGAYVHIPPSIGGFVGADHVAMIIATDIDRLNRITIGLDIGTNTEIVLRRPDKDQLFCLSCPSGPAFEGAHITDGIRAASGAIEEIQLTDALDAVCKTIDNMPAIGLCGSGMIDALAELYRCGIINTRGRLQGDIATADGKFLLVPESASGTGRAIWFSQKDINEIMLAKGAIRAGIETLLEVSQTKVEEVEDVFIAGAFGSFINLTHSVNIGLFPNFPSAQHHQVGNAAAVGAKQSLIDKTCRPRAQEICNKTTFVELARHKYFNRHFAEGIMLPEVAPSLKEK